jgi:DNA-binding IclR family transcriptional regulator
VIGTCLPAFRTAMGKVLLGELPESIVRQLISNLNSSAFGNSKIDPEHSIADIKRVKTQGYATSIGELETGLSSIAVPLHHPLSRQTLSLGLSVPENRMPAHVMVQEFLPELQEAVRLLMLAKV